MDIELRIIGLFIAGGAVTGFMLLASLPFSTAAGLELGLRGARFRDLFGTVFVALLAVASMAVLAVAAAGTLPPYRGSAGVGVTDRPMRLVVWMPELVMAAALGLHAFMHRSTDQLPRAGLAGLAMAATAEALMWMNLVFQVLPGFPRLFQPSVGTVIGVALAGVTGVLALIVPGWAIGRFLRWSALNTPPWLAWTLWPCWLLASTLLRVYGPASLR